MDWCSRSQSVHLSVLGALSQATEHMRFATGATCPTIRYHPVIVAQAAAYEKKGTPLFQTEIICMQYQEKFWSVIIVVKPAISNI